jgi:transcriptional regulator GlxA family with amidase domain
MVVPPLPATVAGDAAFRIDVLAFDGCYASEVFAITDVLRIANHVHVHLGGTRALFDVTITSAGRRTITAADGTRLTTRPPTERPDLVLVPGFELLPFGDEIDATLRQRSREIAFIRAAAAMHRPIAAVCVGAFLVGEAGFLDGRRCTTAWAYTDALARRYPTAMVDTIDIIVHDHGVTTAAAFSAAGDLAMHLVRTTLPPDAATITGKLTLMSEVRPSQRPYVDDRLMHRQSDTLSRQVSASLARDMTEPYDLDALAARLNVSSRTLLRKFKAETGTSPLQHLQTLRIARAKQLLETTDASLEDITFDVGYRDTTTFRRLFHAHTDLTPSDYRRRFSLPG